MGNPYTSVSITGYNSNPPADDGSETEANRVYWETIKEKLPDPLKTAIESINTNLQAAFARVLGGGGVTSTAISYTVQSSDHGKLVTATDAGITITTPSATGVDDPFVFGLVNLSDGDITLDGSGSQTIDGAASIALPQGAGLLLFTDGSNWFTTGQNFARTQIAPQGYLTLISVATNALSPQPTSDQSAATAVYYRPFRGDLVPIPDGTNFSVRAFSELTLTLNSNHVANGIYDVFLFDDAGTIRIGTGPVWNTVTAGSGARGSGAGTTELARLKGLLVNNVAVTMRNGATTYSVGAKSGIYVGSIAIDGTDGQVTCHVTYGQSRKWGVWNAYNRLPIRMLCGDATASWAYSTTISTRPANNATANAITLFAGLAEERVRLDYSHGVSISHTSGGTPLVQNGIGYNSTSAASGKTGHFSVAVSSASAGSTGELVAQHEPIPAIGLQVATALETTSVGGSVTITYNGTAARMLMTASYFG